MVNNVNSDTSANNDDPKKQREGSLNDSQNIDDRSVNRIVQGLSSPDCVVILVNSLVLFD